MKIKTHRVCKLAISAMLFILTKQPNIIFIFFILAERYFSRLFHTVGRYPCIILFLSKKMKKNRLGQVKTRNTCIY